MASSSTTLNNIAPPDLRRGTGIVIPFVLPTGNYRDFFDAVDPTSGQMGGYLGKYHRQTVALFTGSRLRITGGRRASWVLVHGRQAGRPVYVCAPLEQKGPFGGEGTPSHHRAQLRAMIAALRFRRWDNDGFTHIVICTKDSRTTGYMANFLANWCQSGWMNTNGEPVANADMWQALLGEVERWQQKGVTIQILPMVQWRDSPADGLADNQVVLETTLVSWTDP